MRRTPLGNLLSIYRVRAGLSQNRLAHMAGCDPAYVNRIERADTEMNGSSPSRSMTLQLAKALDLSARERDGMLHAAGHATEIDWMAAYDELASVVADKVYETVQEHRSALVRKRR
jgi:transcriptional regulator with XRE-family HTH domain